jgi:hypothetical protein
LHRSLIHHDVRGRRIASSAFVANPGPLLNMPGASRAPVGSGDWSVEESETQDKQLRQRHEVGLCRHLVVVVLHGMLRPLASGSIASVSFGQRV